MEIVTVAAEPAGALAHAPPAAPPDAVVPPLDVAADAATGALGALLATGADDAPPPQAASVRARMVRAGLRIERRIVVLRRACRLSGDVDADARLMVLRTAPVDQRFRHGAAG